MKAIRNWADISSVRHRPRSESLIYTVRILMYPDILCPAQVIPVGYKGTACVQQRDEFPVASTIKTGPGLVVRRDKVNLRVALVVQLHAAALFSSSVLFRPRLPSRYVASNIHIATMRAHALQLISLRAIVSRRTFVFSCANPRYRATRTVKAVTKSNTGINSRSSLFLP